MKTKEQVETAIRLHQIQFEKYKNMAADENLIEYSQRNMDLCDLFGLRIADLEWVLSDD